MARPLLQLASMRTCGCTGHFTNPGGVCCMDLKPNPTPVPIPMVYEPLPNPVTIPYPQPIDVVPQTELVALLREIRDLLRALATPTITYEVPANEDLTP